MHKNFLFLLLTIFIMSACNENKNFTEMSADMGTSPVAARSMSGSRQALMKTEAAYGDNTASAEIDETNKKTKRVRTGNISLNVKDMENLDKKIEEETVKFGGYVASSTFYLNSANMELKIPSEKFDEFFEKAGTLGKVTSKSIREEDVTLQYYDLESRIGTKRILKERYENYLAKAVRVEDLVSIERALNDVVSELESFETRMKHLEHRIGYSTIYLSITLEGGSDIIKTLPSIPKKISDTFFAFAEFLINLFIGIIYIILFGIPLVLVLGFIYFLTFGKIGLIKKFYKILKG